MRISTYDWHHAKGAAFQDYFGNEVPSHYGNYEQEYWALRKSVAIRDVSFFGKVQVTGKDSKLFLHRMLSNDVKSLEPGRGVWALFLDIKGHVQADMKIYSFPESLLIVLQHYVLDNLTKGLDRYIISEDVKMADVTDRWGMFQVFGPQAEEFLKSKGAAALPTETLSFIPADLAGIETHVIRLGTGYALLVPSAQSTAFLDRVDAPLVGAKAFELYRMEQGLPLLNQDIQEMNFPQEARIQDALNFHKGCYLGQEVMARIDAQGHVNRFLMGFDCSEEVQAGETVYKADREVGKITSSGFSPLLQKPFALGYVRRELAKEGEEVRIGHNTTAIVKELPLKPL